MSLRHKLRADLPNLLRLYPLSGKILHLGQDKGDDNQSFAASRQISMK
jgi:hypothetical protein